MVPCDLSFSLCSLLQLLLLLLKLLPLSLYWFAIEDTSGHMSASYAGVNSGWPFSVRSFTPWHMLLTFSYFKPLKFCQNFSSSNDAIDVELDYRRLWMKWYTGRLAFSVQTLKLASRFGCFTKVVQRSNAQEHLRGISSVLMTKQAL